MSTARTWTVDLFIDEHEDERCTRAEVRLHTRDRTALTGEGIAMRNPSDYEVPEIGDECSRCSGRRPGAAPRSHADRRDVRPTAPMVQAEVVVP